MFSITVSPRERSALGQPLIYLLVVLSTLFSFIINAAPVSTSIKKPNSGNDDGLSGSASDGPYNITVQAGIMGAILIVFGLILCFLGVRFFRICLFLIGFYFFANVTYIGMANGGVTSSTLLLVISIVVGVLGGLLLVCCSRLGVAVLGAVALYSLGLWILGWKSGGVITSTTGRAILLGVLALVGFIFGFIREHETVIIGSALVGAYSVVAGIDFFTHTGFIGEADSFINSKNSIDDRVSGGLTWKEYALLAAFVVLALLGMIVQFRMWGRRSFRPAPPAATAGEEAVYTEKPSRFRGLFRRRN
ncbi:Transmembrane 7 super member 3 [Mortierella sp. GBA30]|nr:Transmembrane 7 super member 3 [Mortierella sp. GBA30]